LINTQRHKDIQKLIKILDEAEIDLKYLRSILRRHNLTERFDKFKKLYYE